MALEDLGVAQVNVEDGWVSFSPIALRNNRKYFVEVNFSTNNPDLVYSDFALRFQATTDLGGTAVSTPSVPLQISGTTTVVTLDYYDYYLNRGNVIFQIRRNSFFSEPTTLASVSVQLLVDPDAGDRL